VTGERLGAARAQDTRAGRGAPTGHGEDLELV